MDCCYKISELSSSLKQNRHTLLYSGLMKYYENSSF